MANNDLKQIRKKYGERMMHLCRTLFPTILLTPGLLPSILEKTIAPTSSIAEDIEENGLENEFISFINSFVERKRVLEDNTLTPFEIMRLEGYTLFECHTEAEIQSYRKYYRENELICTIKKKNRLKRNRVFFAVKDNADEIKRSSIPSREDEYGRSVISIQFSRGSFNDVIIVCRYNHTVNDPDCTFGNDLERIHPGLTKSFERYYGLNIQKPVGNVEFLDRLLFYVKANNGKYYRYNCDYDEVYYCDNNIIIDHGIVIDKYAKNKERYILMDYYILDLQEKKISIYDRFIGDSFVDSINDLGPIEKIDVINDGEYRIVKIICKNNNKCQIRLDKSNKIVGYINNDIEEIKDNFMPFSLALTSIELQKVKKINNGFLSYCHNIKEIKIPNIVEIGDGFMKSAFEIVKLNLPKLKRIGNDFMVGNVALREFIAPNLEEVGSRFLISNNSLAVVSFPKLRITSEGFLKRNKLIDKNNLSNRTQEELPEEYDDEFLEFVFGRKRR